MENEDRSVFSVLSSVYLYIYKGRSMVTGLTRYRFKLVKFCELCIKLKLINKRSNFDLGPLIFKFEI